MQAYWITSVLRWACCPTSRCSMALTPSAESLSCAALAKLLLLACSGAERELTGGAAAAGNALALAPCPARALCR